MRRIKKFINLLTTKGEWQITHKSSTVKKGRWELKTGMRERSIWYVIKGFIAGCWTMSKY